MSRAPWWRTWLEFAALVGLAGLLAVGCDRWISDRHLLAEVTGRYEQLAPVWAGKGRVGYGQLSAGARAVISRKQFAALVTWADVCQAFQPAPRPSGTHINNQITNGVELEPGRYGWVEVWLVKEWTGWKLAKVACRPD